MIMIPTTAIARTAVHLSPRAQDLNQKLVATVEEFRRYYPDTTDTDVLSALRAAGMSSGQRRKPAMVATAAAVLAGAGAAVMAANEGASGGWAAVVGLVAVIGIVAVVLMRLIRQG